MSDEEAIEQLVLLYTGGRAKLPARKTVMKAGG
jgi:hypothetical protein